MPYNPNKHHRRSIRLKGYDYSQAGLYFVTICTRNREYLFGNTRDGEMILNDMGKIADECWLEIPTHFPDAILHEYIVMPNHVHGIIELTQNNITTSGAQNTGGNSQPPPTPADCVVGAENFLPLPPPPPRQQQHNKFQKMIPRSIGSIVKGFKIGVTKWCRNNTDIENIWQRNYHEHIIRNEKSYLTISHYIANNPAKWKDDTFYKE
jgi:putative transposase